MSLVFDTRFNSKSIQIKYLIDFYSKINVMMPKFAAKLGFTLKIIDVGTLKIDGLSLKIYYMIPAVFLL